jgi:hypothetical protein
MFVERGTRRSPTASRISTPFGRAAASAMLSPDGARAWQIHTVGLDVQGTGDTGMVVAYEPIAIYAVKWNHHLGRDGVVLIKNLFSVIAHPFKPLAVSAPGHLVVAAITVIGGGVNAGMSYQYLASSSDVTTT